ncbi:MAG: DUF6790 family protein [Chloroflexota bacterium]
MSKTVLRFIPVIQLIGIGWMIRLYIGTTLFIALIPLAALIHLWRDKQPRTTKRVLEVFLLYFLVVGYGFGGLWGFVGHFFFGDMIAQDIGWATGSQFQIELAFYHLGFGVVGILAWWIRDNLWTALALGKAIFLYGAAYVHIRDIILFDNWSPSNAGFEVLYLGDLILPTVILALLAAYKWHSYTGPSEDAQPLPSPAHVQLQPS